jgi:hypothetical protein
VRSVKSVGAGKSGRDNADAVKGCSGTVDSLKPKCVSKGLVKDEGREG